MAPRKITALVLRRFPYRESSIILHMLERSMGPLHGIARGVRSVKSGSLCLERGVVIEALAYVKPNRGLHTVTAVQVVDFFPAVRTDLYKTAMRDAAFELIMKHVPAGAPPDELYPFVLEFLHTLECTPVSRAFPFQLWRFCAGYAALSGFGLSPEVCAECGRSRGTGQGGVLCIRTGGLLCDRCAASPNEGYRCSPAVLGFLGSGTLSGELIRTGTLERRNLTTMLTDYCRHHCEIRSPLKSMSFMTELIGG